MIGAITTMRSFFISPETLHFSLFIKLETFSTLKRILIKPDFTTSGSAQSSKSLTITFQNCFLSFT